MPVSKVLSRSTNRLRSFRFAPTVALLSYGALRSGSDLALVEEPDGLLVKLLLATGVLATLKARLLVVMGLLHYHEIAPNLSISLA